VLAGETISTISLGRACAGLNTACFAMAAGA